MTVTKLRPFRFGVQASLAPSGMAWTELARRVEDLGYDVFTMPDHFGAQFAPLPALTAVAAATSRLRVGTLVLDNDFRHPLALAKELATLDVLSGGRVEIGIGAGWMAPEYQQTGIPFDSPKVRIDRLQEAVELIRGAMADGEFSFDGKHYQVAQYDGRPAPIQRPHPPILIGGGGTRMLRYAGRNADIVGINPTLTTGAITAAEYDTMSAEAIDAKVELVREAAGERFADIELNIRVFMAQMVDGDVPAAFKQIAAMTGATPEAVAASPYALVGSPEQMIDDLVARRERWGFSYVIVGADVYEEFAPVVARLAGQ